MEVYCWEQKHIHKGFINGGLFIILSVLLLDTNIYKIDQDRYLGNSVHISFVKPSISCLS